MKTSKLFDKSLTEVPNDVRIEVDLSFAIADKLDAILTQKSLTQKQFAKLVGKKEPEISRWLSGTHNFTIRTIAQINSALNCNIITV